LISGFRLLHVAEFTCEFKAFFCRYHCDNLIDHCGGGNGPLNDTRIFRRRRRKHGYGYPCKYQGYAGMGQKGQPQIFSYGIRRLRYPASKPGPEIFPACPCANIDGSIYARPQNQMIIQRSSQIQDNKHHGKAEDRIKIIHDLFQPFRGNHIGKHGGKSHAHKHKIQNRPGHQERIT